MRNSLTFLLADDDADDASIFQDALLEVDHSISLQYARDGQETIEILKERNSSLPDLIFLDLNMPRMDGKECLKLLKLDSELSRIPVIMYTTSSQAKDIEETMMSGALCFITKPSSMKELIRILSTIVQGFPTDLQKEIRMLSNNSSTFIVSS
ncbi:response regulator [Chitinophagaceae bacterium LB-8]|uniref:Response regulator n=1 Tax=Paraflavisolibacter caeni TaxID=2982496 RepID=A0A9X3BHN1_9BACT|nr:response regulator [Paraflavisolibacter caeni]MCU7548888.1 response regulator [Paraflavisolibacter caeni]